MKASPSAGGIKSFVIPPRGASKSYGWRPIISSVPSPSHSGGLRDWRWVDGCVGVLMCRCVVGNRRSAAVVLDTHTYTCTCTCTFTFTCVFAPSYVHPTHLLLSRVYPHYTNMHIQTHTNTINIEHHRRCQQVLQLTFNPKLSGSIPVGVGGLSSLRHRTY